MKVFVTGFMGVGKSFVAKKLAKNLHLKFYDLDKMIENELNFSVFDCVKNWGEELFREIESSVLKNFVQNNDNFVMACGGGTPCFNNNIKLINENGISIFIEMPPKAIFSRLKNTKNIRPLLNEYKDELLLQRIEELLEERQNFYSQAKIKINALDYNIDNIISEILKN